MVTVTVPEVSEKPKKKKAAKQTKKKETISSEMVADLIVGCSAAVASKPSAAHWEIDKKEATQISEPLVRVIEKNENLKKVAEHSDSIALVMACATVFVPRAYISLMMAKENRSKKKPKQKEVKTNDTETGKIKERDRKDGAEHRNAAPLTSIDSSLSEILNV